MYETDKKYDLTLVKLGKGLKMVLEQYPHQISLESLDDIDSVAADCVIQCAIFDDIIYGYFHIFL